jgi:Uma2 family endonuclease
MARRVNEDPHHLYTLEEYFALERAGERRYEYWDGDIVCMSGGTLRHGQISRNVFRTVDRKISGSPCQAFTADMAVKTSSPGPYRYPDASVVCGEVLVDRINGIDTLVNPIAVVEVLSPGTEARDRNEKRMAYQAIVSMREYLIVSQDIPHVTHYVREGESWRRADYSMMTEVIECRSLGLGLTLAEIYEGVTFE